MNVNLGPVFDQFVADLVDTGYYQSQSEVLREGLRLLKEREDLRRMRLSDLRQAIAAGARQADRGEFVDGPKTLANIRRRRTNRQTSTR
jgi:antitoxin ParD1/3/4